MQYVLVVPKFLRNALTLYVSIFARILKMYVLKFASWKIWSKEHSSPFKEQQKKKKITCYI